MTFKTLIVTYSVAAASVIVGSAGLSLVQEREACAANMKQIYKGLVMYAADYDDLIPPAAATRPVKMKPFGQGGIGWVKEWVAMMLPYVKSKQVFFCPANAFNGTFGERRAGGEDFTWSSYYIFSGVGKQCWFDNDGKTLLHLSKAPNPSTTRYLVDFPWILETSPGNWKVFTGHGTDYNCLFLDGHVEYLDGKVPPSKATSAGSQ